MLSSDGRLGRSRNNGSADRGSVYVRAEARRPGPCGGPCRRPRARPARPSWRCGSTRPGRPSALDPGGRPRHRRPRRWAAPRGRVRTRCPARGRASNAGHVADRLLAIPFHQVAERGFEAHEDGMPRVVGHVESERESTVAAVVEAIDDTGVELADWGGFEPATTSTPSSSRRSSPTRSARVRVRTWSFAGTTARPSPTGVPRRPSRSSFGCCSASAAPTGPSCSSPATATSSAPVPSGTSACTAATCG